MDLVAKRYGQRPSSLLPDDAISDDLRLWFDLNVALKGMAAEAIAAQPPTPKGATRTRSDALRLIQKAKADVLAMEQEAARKRA